MFLILLIPHIPAQLIRLSVLVVSSPFTSIFSWHLPHHRPKRKDILRQSIVSYSKEDSISRTTFSIFVSGLYIHYHNFYFIFSCHLPYTHPVLRCICSCSFTDTASHAIEVSPFYRNENGRCLPRLRLRTKTDPVSETLCV